MQKQRTEVESVKVDQELVAYPVYRALHETIYFIRFLWFRLTEVDILLSAGIGLTLWLIVQQTGNQKAMVFGLFRFDPWGWLGAIVVSATIISIFHKVRPEGDIDKVVRNWFQKHQFAATAAVRDKVWTPSNHYR